MMLLGSSLLAGYVAKSELEKRNFSFSDPVFKDYEITFADELGEGEMRELKIDESEKGKILIVRYRG